MEGACRHRDAHTHLPFLLTIDIFLLLYEKVIIYLPNCDFINVISTGVVPCFSTKNIYPVDKLGVEANVCG